MQNKKLSPSYILQQSVLVFRMRYLYVLPSLFRRMWYGLLGMKIGKGTHLPRIFVTWPHQVSFGRNCVLEHHINFKFDGIWKKEPSIIISDDVFIGAGCEFNISGGIRIGKRTMIASGCKFIDHNHGTSMTESMNTQKPSIDAIEIGEEVWLGVNVVVLKGVKIGKGAVIAAGSVLLGDVGEYEIFGGVPAKLIKKRS
jgi:acetyltransferase-like isoleucine patch superfamily enzyme